jgi:F-type H+-transporting ATPase subunit epsilon
VSILSERALLAEEIDVSEARTDLEAAQGIDGDEREQQIRRAEARIRAVEKTS